MTTKEILIAARARIEDPNNWTKGALARDEYGREVDPSNENAVCWCMGGAVDFVEPTRFSEYNSLAKTGALEALSDATGVNFFGDQFNDSPDRTHAEVLAAFDKAIESIAATPPGQRE